ncbi:unnamed protein product [Prorocentrum cordatum]|uniref:Uncharacterized protein n=1 Tax=Prorocentrum cordatum TaxID=2364126 RepID=A0ABN9W6T1_9DINO|nr:unnamed protein product [Polarella glacialis]
MSSRCERRSECTGHELDGILQAESTAALLIFADAQFEGDTFADTCWGRSFPGPRWRRPSSEEHDSDDDADDQSASPLQTRPHPGTDAAGEPEAEAARDPWPTGGRGRAPAAGPVLAGVRARSRGVAPAAAPRRPWGIRAAVAQREPPSLRAPQRSAERRLAPPLMPAAGAAGAVSARASLSL